MKTKQHHIILNDFTVESGKISFQMLQKLAEMLQKVAGGALRLTVEGRSSKKGPKPKWLQDSVDFQLTGIQKGSTDLVAEAPVLNDTLQQPQLPLFSRSPESLKKYTGIDLALETFGQAFQADGRDDLLDKHLLNEMKHYRSLFGKGKGSIRITGYVNEQPTEIKYKSFDNIKKLEEQTPPAARARITGVLDLMQFSKELIQIQTQKGTVRALLTDEVSFNNISQLFGEKVTVDGIANYKPSGKISAIEISNIRLATDQDEWFTKQPMPVKEQLDLKEFRTEQKVEGTDLDNIIGKWPGEEPIEELIELLD